MPEIPGLGDMDAHVWAAQLAPPPSLLEAWRHVLSADELGRVRRFRRPSDGQRYLAAHAILRFLLARYVSIAPGELEFRVDELGKPHLAASNISFNLSHSGDVALYGVTRHRRIGVDVELVRQNIEMMDIAQRFFAPGEAAALRAMPEHERAEGFFNCWTRKEAYLKAHGCGLGGDTRAFEVTLKPGDSPAVLREAGAPAGRRWSTLHWNPAPQYVAAAVAEGDGIRFRNCWWHPQNV